MDRARKEYAERAAELIERADLEGLDRFLEPLHPADVADVLEELRTDQQVALLRRLGNERAAEVLTEVDQHSGQTLLLLLSDKDVVSLLGEMTTDDAADIMSSLPPERTERVEALLPSEDREQLQELMEFDEDTAGGIMELERIAVREDATLAEATEIVRREADEIENLQRVYIVDEHGKLTGQITVLDLILHPPSTPVRDVVERNVISVPVDMDQEEVASLFGKYDVFTLPVVDAAGKLVGRITVDDIIDVIEEEASEDITYIAGTTEDELGEPSPFKISRTRLPWLIAGLVGQALAAVIMSRYEASLATYVALAFFIPLIVGTAGNVGIQAAVVVVRELALGQIDVLHVSRRVLKEIFVASINGIVLGVVLFVIVLIWRTDVELGMLLLVALLAVVFAAAFIGSSVPLVLHRWKVDPAIATGPFITVLNDIVGLSIYLYLASLYLTRFR